LTDGGDELISGLPDGVRRLLAAPPVTEKKLLELSVTWTGLQPNEARMADVLRLFVITWGRRKAGRNRSRRKGRK